MTAMSALQPSVAAPFVPAMMMTEKVPLLKERFSVRPPHFFVFPEKKMRSG